MFQTARETPGVKGQPRRTRIKRLRHRSLFVAQMLVPQHSGQLVLVTNYAPLGFAIKALFPPEEHARITIDIAGYGRCTGVVRWRSARSFGVRLDSPLDVLSLSTMMPGPAMADYALPHSPAFEGMYMQTAFQQEMIRKPGSP